MKTSIPLAIYRQSSVVLLTHGMGSCVLDCPAGDINNVSSKVSGVAVILRRGATCQMPRYKVLQIRSVRLPQSLTLDIPLWNSGEACRVAIRILVDVGGCSLMLTVHIPCRLAVDDK